MAGGGGAGEVEFYYGESAVCWQLNFQNSEQKQDIKRIYGESKYSAGYYVTAWYKKSLSYIKEPTSVIPAKAGIQENIGVYSMDSRFRESDVREDSFSENNSDIKCAFVSTNSITQGEQVAYMLWPWINCAK